MTPKQSLTQFLRFWKRNNLKGMYSLTTFTWKGRYGKSAFQGTGLKSFEIIDEKQNGPICDFNLMLNNELHKVRLICEKKEYTASIDGVWGVFPGSFRKVK